jgi:hypothetical protein
MKRLRRCACGGPDILGGVLLRRGGTGGRVDGQVFDEVSGWCSVRGSDASLGLGGRGVLTARLCVATRRETDWQVGGRLEVSMPCNP